jgi:hypothetical protein
MEIIDSPTKVFENVSNLIESSNFKFDYKVVNESSLDLIVSFVNENYIDKDGATTSLKYSKELIKYHLNDSIPIFFYGKNNPTKIIALIIGRFARLSVFNKDYGAMEVNFFCIIPQLRKLNLPRLLKAYLIRECIKKYDNLVEFAYYTTNNKINVEPICKKNYIHRCINFNQLKRLNIINEARTTSIYKKLYSKFIYPEKFKSYEIIYQPQINILDLEQLTLKINSYQKQFYDIYEKITPHILSSIIESDAFEKFLIKNNDSIEGFFTFFKLDIINKNLITNNTVKTLYLYYYYVNGNVNGNVIEYLEFIGEYMNKNLICDMFLTNLFDDTEKIPDRYFQGSGKLFYNLWNAKTFNIKENKLRLIML